MTDIYRNESIPTLHPAASEALSKSGVIKELSSLDVNDTIWVIHFMQQQLARKQQENVSSMQTGDPLYGLNFLRDLNKGGVSFEELRDEYISEKYFGKQ
ncbi:MAG: hypothetical protein IJ612_02065 [Prevotella sp.]|nr:hypothetical protein [Prevotella sp.]